MDYSRSSCAVMVNSLYRLFDISIYSSVLFVPSDWFFLREVVNALLLLSSHARLSIALRTIKTAESFLGRDYNNTFDSFIHHGASESLC